MNKNSKFLYKGCKLLLTLTFNESYFIKAAIKFLVFRKIISSPTWAWVYFYK